MGGGKIRRGGYIFITWQGDHPRKVLELIKELELEGLI